MSDARVFNVLFAVAAAGVMFSLSLIPLALYSVAREIRGWFTRTIRDLAGTRTSKE